MHEPLSVKVGSSAFIAAVGQTDAHFLHLVHNVTCMAGDMSDSILISLKGKFPGTWSGLIRSSARMFIILSRIVSPNVFAFPRSSMSGRPIAIGVQLVE
jgi:hypothetical protein